VSGPGRRLRRLLGWRREQDGTEDRHRPATGAGDGTALYDRAVVFDRQGDEAEAERWYRRAAEAGDHRAMLCLVGLLDEKGDQAEAERWHLRALEVEGLLPPDGGPHPMQELREEADLVLAGDRHAEAVEEYRAALRAAESSLGPDHPQTINTRTLLAEVAIAAGHPIAEETQRRLVADLARVAGPDSEALLVARSNLGNFLASVGRDEEAADLHRQVLEDHRRVLGTRHPGTIVTAASLGNTLSRLGRDREAAALAREVLPAATEVLGPDHPLTRDVRAAARRP
jgi:tetratricopeptide (TPR) repeat protein